MFGRLRGGAAAAAAVLVTSALVVQPAAADPTPGPTTTTTTPLPAGPPTWATVHAAQVEVVTRNEQVGVDAATATLSKDTASLDAASSNLTADTAKAARAATAAADAAQTLSVTTAKYSDAVTANQEAISALATDRGRLAQVGIALYMGPDPDVPNVADVSGAQASADGETYLNEGGKEVTTLVHADQEAQVKTAADEKRLAAEEKTDQTRVDQTDQASLSAKNTVATDQLQVKTETAATATDQKAVTQAQATMAAAIAAMGAPAPDGSPTIIGTPTLVPAELAGWFTSSYYQDQTTAPPAQLAAFYINQGNAEQVRGDVAFAQAILETGGFSSPDAINLSNFAGVGHCDSCGTGLAFPGPRGGVQGQIQLLRLFGSPKGTTLMQPAVIPQVGGTQGSAGCCTSWQSLTGHWATDPDYGQKIMNLYQQMLAYALSQPAINPTSPQAGFAAATMPPAAGTPGSGSSTTSTTKPKS